MRIKQLSPRLAKVAEFVRSKTSVCDVGTDHAELPVFLCVEHDNAPIYASDVNVGPLQSAKAEIDRRRLSERITLIQSDGLQSIPTCDDVVIAGMGGETIAEIIESMPERFLNNNLRLVLQPMTKVQTLRERLERAGFEIITENTVTEAHRKYTIMYCKVGASIARPLERATNSRPYRANQHICDINEN